ncbi:MAG TPA: outer membrane protein transport protein [Kofleriaceae bacterium]|nr:outer membrane protein transport protein [Kofleriaceae bacterium]
MIPLYRRASARYCEHMVRAALVVSALALAVPAHAGGFGIPEVGVRRTAMGSIIGRPDDPSALYHNPAGLVLQDDWTLYVSAGIALLSTSFELAPWDQSNRFLGTTPGANGYYGAVQPTRALAAIPMLAITGHILPRLYVGAAAFVGNATGAEFSSDAVTRYHLIDGYVIAPQAVLGAAYRVTDQLALGATAGVVDIRVHGERDVFPIVDGADISSIVGTSPKLVLDGSGWAPTWMVGAYGQPLANLTWGAAIIGRVDATLTGPVAITYSQDASIPGDQLVGTQTTQQLLPWTFQAGANVDVSKHVELGGELRYWLYRQLESEHTDVTGIFLVRSLDTTKDYSDSWEVSGGVRVHDLDAAPRLDLMAGLQYDHSPAPPDTITLDQPSFTHVALHSGARYSFGRYRVGASYIQYWYFVPTITDSITSPPTNIRGSGTNHIATVSLEVKL